ncbi:esterase E4 [Musca domestica]|uniref:Carboxylic ester hydrolase n=1 Tax=Musca domestica TaxID=7370 RepID=A0A1I8N0C0_MUSDO|nr:esterase E4 [Musca domestica]
MKALWFVFIFFNILFSQCIAQIKTAEENNEEDPDPGVPVVQTSLGKIRGKMLTTLYGKLFYAYRGIRYAKAPVDDLRFKAPIPVEPWNDTLKATSDSLVCPQPGVLQVVMSEDCLKLNVFTKNVTARLPVMVYIHGGANVLGSGHSLYEAGPQYLLDHDVVMVAFNYRLGALGFLSTQTAEYPGNYGYLDQVLALQWVSDHISHFGGDPESVTIFGMSAGSMAVSLHLASPLSKGLFHKAILMSGSATNHYDIDNIYWTRKLAKELSCPQYHPSDIVECLREISWKTIVNKCAEWEPYSFVNMKWNYEVDGKFLPEHPSKLFAEGKFNKVPMIVGFAGNELDFSVQHQENNTRLLHDLAVSFDMYAPEIFLYKPESSNLTPDQLKSKRIWNFYMGSETKELNVSNLHTFGEIFSDAILGHGIHRLVSLANKDTPVYYYRTDYVGHRSLYPDNYGQSQGVGHADDLQYVMPGLWYGTQMSEDNPDIFMVKRMTQLWTTFATTGKPTADDVKEWSPVGDSNLAILYNGKSAEMGQWPYTERYQLWDEMFPIEKSGVGCHLPIMGIITILVLSIWKLS